MACHVILFEQQGLFFGRTAGLMSERKDGKKKSINREKKEGNNKLHISWVLTFFRASIFYMIHVNLLVSIAPLLGSQC